MDGNQPGEGGSGTWRGLQVYFYAEDKDDLLLDCVRPLFGRVAARTERLLFTRHWLRGPHLRLAFRAPDDTVVPTAEREITRYLAAHPSTARVDERALLATHRRLAEQEQEPGPLTPLHPDNSVQHAPHDRRVPVLGGAAAAALLEDFYHETNDTAFDMLAHVRAGGDRLVLALDLMLATAHALWPGIDRGFISYRSHAEGFIVRAADPAARRAFCEERYRAQSLLLRERLTAVLACLDGGGGDVPFITDWVAVLARYRAAAEPLIGSGELSFAAAQRSPEQGGAERRGWDEGMLAHSTFHQLLQGEGGRMEQLQRDPAFLGYRFALNYLYLHLNRIGLRPVERFLLCHLISDAVEEHYGISAHDFVAS
ncbi:thiopeptide maturation pyridine synthase [Saccharopolyspora cebuensis]|uniref:Thiopeptide maturation pyridine synthase n=1 Tax=Saccharopolyspora cebuensis TaxID=418759 RepID=A0ABV4CIN8_9PSEU